ncbi:class E sortase [Tessaracoccus sp. HDW20]|uniref:sortase n=1 Tax=Tessaracoccus coleopterorum TaxID=2714950 RepID=UPI0018D2FF3C|nr:sortase [Tessaracoccus coleopterorum]NHB84588.1 class E sortase [Tessaracoccus coleopterorum]
MGTVKAQRAQEATRRGISPLLVLLLILLVVALGLGGVVGWTFFGTNLVAARTAEGELAGLKASFAEADPPADDAAPVVAQPRSHAAAWILRIPSLDLEAPVIAGVDPADLGRGVGWYPGTALPGQLGNFAIAGHRFSNGEPFRRLLELRVGDEVVVETPHAAFTYTLISAPGELTVQADDSWVIDPVPGAPDEVPTRAFLTLTTAEDVIETLDRAVGFGTLTETETR